MKTILIILGILFILYRAFIWFFGNWRMTLRRVISIYTATRQLCPGEDNEYYFFHVLEQKYPLVVRGPRRRLYDKKQEVLYGYLLSAAHYDDLGALGDLIRRYTLPSAILCCLLIENQSMVRKYQENPEKLYELIEGEVARRGFPKYCTISDQVGAADAVPLCKGKKRLGTEWRFTIVVAVIMEAYLCYSAFHDGIGFINWCLSFLWSMGVVFGYVFWPIAAARRELKKCNSSPFLVAIVIIVMVFLWHIELMARTETILGIHSIWAPVALAVIAMWGVYSVKKERAAITAAQDQEQTPPPSGREPLL